MDCMLFTFKNSVPLMRLGAAVLWHILIPLTNSFNKTEAAIFFTHATIREDFPLMLIELVL